MREWDSGTVMEPLFTRLQALGVTNEYAALENMREWDTGTAGQTRDSGTVHEPLFTRLQALDATNEYAAL